MQFSPGRRAKGFLFKSCFHSYQVNAHKRPLRGPTFTMLSLSQSFMSWAHAGHAQARLPLQQHRRNRSAFRRGTFKKSFRQRLCKPTGQVTGRLNAVIILPFSKSCSLNQPNHEVPNKHLSWLYLKRVSFKENPPLLPFHSQLSSSAGSDAKDFLFHKHIALLKGFHLSFNSRRMSPSDYACLTSSSL